MSQQPIPERAYSDCSLLVERKLVAMYAFQRVQSFRIHPFTSLQAAETCRHTTPVVTVRPTLALSIMHRPRVFPRRQCSGFAYVPSRHSLLLLQRYPCSRAAPNTCSARSLVMVSSFNISIPLNIPRDLLWRVRATETFMQFLVSNGALARMDASPAVPTYDTPGSKTRTQTYVPAQVAIPDSIKSLIDDSYIEVKDIQKWDDQVPYVQSFNIKPAVMADVVHSSGTLSIDDAGDDRCIHTISGSCGVGVPLLGWYVEQAIITNMNEFYKSYSSHIDDFVKMAVFKFGDGTPQSLSQAIDRICSEEKALDYPFLSPTDVPN